MKLRVLEMFRYLGKMLERALAHFVGELSQNKVILCWIYAIAYLVLIFYCVTRNQSSQSAAIYTTGGLMGTIFASYVTSASYEKIAKYRVDAPSAGGLDGPGSPATGDEPEPEHEGPQQ